MKQENESQNEEPAHIDPTRAQKVMAGGDITQNVSHRTETNVYNQDETKQVLTCVVSGRKAIVTAGNTCRSCNKWAINEYFDERTRLCNTCKEMEEEEKKKVYREMVAQFLGDDHQLDPQERKQLDEKANELRLSKVVQNRIESQERSKDVSSLDEQMTPSDKSRLNRAQHALHEKGDPKTAFKHIEGLQDAYPQNKVVAELYSLIAVEADPVKGLSFLNHSPIFRHDSAIKSLRLIETYESMANDIEATKEERNALRIFGTDRLIQAKSLERLIDLFYENEQEKWQAEDVKIESENWQKPGLDDDPYLHFVQAYLDHFLGNRESLDPVGDQDLAKIYFLRKKRQKEKKIDHEVLEGSSDKSSSDSAPKIQSMPDRAHSLTIDIQQESNAGNQKISKPDADFELGKSQYRKLFMECIAEDDRIVPEIRAILHEEAERLGLSANEVEGIESEVRMKRQSRLFAIRSPEERVRIKKFSSLLFNKCQFKDSYEGFKALASGLKKDREVLGLYVLASIAHKPEEALSILEEHSNYHVDSPRKAFLRICTLEALSKDAEASNELKRALYLFPDDPYLNAKSLERLTDLYLFEEQEEEQLEDMKDYFEELALPKDSSDPYLSFVMLYYRMAYDQSFTVKDMLESLQEPYYARIKSNVRDMEKSLSKKKGKEDGIAKLIDAVKESSDGDGLSLSDAAKLLDGDVKRTEMLLHELTEAGRLEKFGEGKDFAWFLTVGSETRAKKVIAKSPLVPSDAEKPDDEQIFWQGDIERLYKAALINFRERNGITRKSSGYADRVSYSLEIGAFLASEDWESWRTEGVDIAGFSNAFWGGWSKGFFLTSIGLYVKESADKLPWFLDLKEICYLPVSTDSSFNGVLIGDYKLKLSSKFNSREAYLFFIFFQKLILTTLEYSRKLQIFELGELKDEADVLSKPRYESAYRKRLEELENILNEIE